MNIMTILLTLSVFWLICLFIALPIGIKIDQDHREGHADSAPSKHLLGKKIVYTFIISILLTLLYWTIIWYFALEF